MRVELIDADIYVDLLDVPYTILYTQCNAYMDIFYLATNALLLNEADRVHASYSCMLDGIMCRSLNIKEVAHGTQLVAVVLKYVPCV